MGAIFTSPRNTVIAGIVLLIVIMLVIGGVTGQMTHLDMAWSTFAMRWLHVISGVLWIGLLFYVGSMLGWLQVLSTRPLSQVYPAFVSLSFLLLLSASFLLLREPLRWTHFAGSGLILAGIWISFQR